MDNQRTFTILDYRHMIEAFRTSLRAEFPEFTDRIYVVDQSRNADEELARASIQLGIPDLRERLREISQEVNSDIFGQFPRYSGKALTVTAEDGREVFLAYGWGYSRNLDQLPLDTSISETDMLALTKVTVHEVAHGLEMAYRPDNPLLNMPEGVYTRFQESFAELFAKDVGIRNGLLPRSRAELIAAIYDEDRLHRHTDMYDPSEELQTLLTRYYQGQGDELYRGDFTRFLHLRDSFERTTRITWEHTGDLATENARNAFTATRIITIEELRRQGKTPEEIAEYILARPDVYHDAQQAAAGRAHLAEAVPLIETMTNQGLPLREQRLPPYHFAPEPPIDIRSRAASAFLRYSQSGDPIQREVSILLTEEWLFQQDNGHLPSTGISFQEGQNVLQNPRCTDWAERILARDTIEEIAAGLRKCLPAPAANSANEISPPAVNNYNENDVVRSR